MSITTLKILRCPPTHDTKTKRWELGAIPSATAVNQPKVEMSHCGG